MSYKNDHALVIANKYGGASSAAKAELYETYDRLRDLTISGSTGTGSGFGSAGGFLWQLANLFSPSSFIVILPVHEKGFVDFYESKDTKFLSILRNCERIRNSTFSTSYSSRA